MSSKIRSFVQRFTGTIFMLFGLVAMMPIMIVGFDRLCFIGQPVPGPCGMMPMAFEPWMLAAVGLGITFLKVGFHMMPQDTPSEGKPTLPFGN